jgi:hypothetical protein
VQLPLADKEGIFILDILQRFGTDYIIAFEMK